MILDVGTVPASGRRSLPQSVQRLDLPPVFTFDDVRGSVDRFAQRVLGTLVGESLRKPRLVVNVEDKSVTLDGETCYPGDVFVRILNELVKAGGRWVSRREMQSDPILKLQSRLDRDIKSLKSKLRIGIRSSRKGFSLPTEYLE
jgi:hypothetical protein